MFLSRIEIRSRYGIFIYVSEFANTWFKVWLIVPTAPTVAEDDEPKTAGLNVSTDGAPPVEPPAVGLVNTK